MTTEAMSRRDFLGVFSKAALATGAALYLPDSFAQAQSETRSLEVEKPVEYVKPIWPLFGIHDTPNAGGSSVNRNLAVSDFHNLGASWAVIIQPERAYIDMLSQAGVKVIARIYQPDCRPSQYHINEILRQFNGLPANIIPFNEVNLEWETNGQYIPADVHIKRDFLTVADQLIAANQGHKVGLTPLSPNLTHFGIVVKDYYKQMLQTVVQEKGVDWTKSNLFIPLHFYPVDNNLDDEWKKIIEIHRFNQQLVGPQGLPIHITETCFFTSDGAPTTSGTVAEKNIAMLQIGMPDLPIESFCLWVLANFAQRPESDRNNATHIVEFERSALRHDESETGQTQLYQQLARIYREKSYVLPGTNLFPVAA